MLKKFTSIALIALVANNVRSIKGMTTDSSEQNQPRPARLNLRAVPSKRKLFINTADMGGPLNARSNELYSTIPYGEDLKTVGKKFTISPHDMFDEAPSAGLGHADLLSKKLKFKSKNAAGAVAYAEKHLGTSLMEKLVVPTPNQSIVDKELTVISTESIMQPSHPVFCHQAEVDKWFCHESQDTTEVTKVTVTTDDSNIPSVVWTACHDEKQYWCHILNVGDAVFVPKKEKDDHHMNPIPSVTEKCDSYALQLTKDIKTALEDTDALKDLCEKVDASEIESSLVNVLMKSDDICIEEVKLLLLENIRDTESTYNDSISCVPQLTKEKMLIESYLVATVCGKECIGLASGLISGLHVKTFIDIGNAIEMETADSDLIRFQE